MIMMIIIMEEEELMIMILTMKNLCNLQSIHLCILIK